MKVALPFAVYIVMVAYLSKQQDGFHLSLGFAKKVRLSERVYVCAP